MDAVKSLNVPFFGVHNVSSEFCIMSEKKEIDAEFAGVRNAIDKKVSGGRGEDGGCCRGSTSLARMREGAGRVTHLVDSDWGWEIFKGNIVVIGLMGFDVMSGNFERKTGFDLEDFT